MELKICTDLVNISVAEWKTPGRTQDACHCVKKNVAQMTGTTFSWTSMDPIPGHWIHQGLLLEWWFVEVALPRLARMFQDESGNVLEWFYKGTEIGSYWRDFWLQRPLALLGFGIPDTRT